MPSLLVKMYTNLTVQSDVPFCAACTTLRDNRYVQNDFDNGVTSHRLCIAFDLELIRFLRFEIERTAERSRPQIAIECKYNIIKRYLFACGMKNGSPVTSEGG